jgi:threonine dehydratase
VRQSGVITHSSGNHAQALALAARTHGVRATIVMPTISTPAKIAGTQGYGARVVFSGSTADEREAVVADLMAKDPGMVLVPPYDAVDIVLGQGTQALELEAQVREMVSAQPELSVHGNKNAGRLDAVIAPCGGGGMLSGIATALAGTGTRVFGAEPSFQGADDARRGLAMVPPQRITHVSSLTVADGVRTPVGKIPWSVISDPQKVAGVFAVSEEQICQAMRLVWERMKVVIEPTAALGLAVAMFDEGFREMVQKEGGEEGWDVGVVFSGGNVAMEAVGDLLARGAKKWDVERAEGVVGVNGEKVAENVAG